MIAHSSFRGSPPPAAESVASAACPRLRAPRDEPAVVIRLDAERDLAHGGAAAVRQAARLGEAPEGEPARQRWREARGAPGRGWPW